MTNMFQQIQDLQNRQRKIEEGGGSEKTSRQHQKGKLTARERIALLIDPGTFVELYAFIESRTDIASENKSIPGEGVVTGYGKIHGRPVYLFAQDFTVFGGSLGEMHAQKIVQVMELAAKNGVPIIGLNDSGGARIQEGVLSLDGYGQLFYRHALYSGVIPQISLILGPCAGGAAYSPALTDFVFMADGISQMFITGPKVIETVTGEAIEAEELGGAHIHTSVSGNAHFRASSEEKVIQAVRALLTYLPQNNKEKPPSVPYENETDYRADLLNAVPADGQKPYDIQEVIHLIVDSESFMEVQKEFAKNIVIGFARIRGETVGLVCNQPKWMAGGLDIDSSDKAARFIRFCDAFNIPLLTLEDVTGFLPGIQQEQGGIIRHGAKIIYAYAEATVPKITVILRKAYGGAYVALNSKAIGADFVFAWPTAEIAVMGPQGAVSILHGREIAESDNPEKMREEKIKNYQKNLANPYVAASKGIIDDIIDPRETRVKIVQAFDMLKTKKEQRPVKKHGNIPL